MAQRMPLPLTVSCFSKIQIGFTFLVLAYPGSPGQRAFKRVYVCMYVSVGTAVVFVCSASAQHVTDDDTSSQLHFLIAENARLQVQSYNGYGNSVTLFTVRTHTPTPICPGLIRVSRYRISKTSLDFTEARDSEWQWHQLGHTPVCTSLQTDNHASTPPLSFLQAGCPSRRQTNSVKALEALYCLLSDVRSYCVRSTVVNCSICCHI